MKTLVEESAPGQARRKSTALSPVVSSGRLVVEARIEMAKGGGA